MRIRRTALQLVLALLLLGFLGAIYYRCECAIAAESDFVETLFWGSKAAGVRVSLPVAKVAIVAELLNQAWTRKAPRRLAAAHLSR